MSLSPAPAPAPARPLSPRRLHLGHFAFMRAVVQGLDHGDCWRRYLAIEGEAGDARVVRSTLRWIREALVRIALQTDRFQLARLLQLDVQTLGTPDPALPSLTEFAEAQGLDDEPEAVQIAAFEAAHGRASRRLQRRQRLVRRQLDALRWLELQGAQVPQAADAVRAWFAPALAGHLEAAGLLMLGQLAERINAIGPGWWRGVRAVGPVKAARLVDWLHEHGDSPGLRLDARAALPRRALNPSTRGELVTAATAVVPIERLIVPAGLDGRDGRFRRPQAQCLLAAGDDLAAVRAWIASKTPGSHTQRAYRKEAERFVLWAIVQRGRALSSMTQEDCVAYRDFLADPQPASRWCAPRSRERWSPAWRPFEGPLSPSAQRYALTVLKNLYGFLVDQNYLMGNPWSAVSVARSIAPRLQTARSLSPAQWRRLDAELDQLPPGSASHRLRVALRLLYATGLRLSEIVAARAGDLEWVEFPPEGDDGLPEQGWMLRVVGKGRRVRQVPVPDDVVRQLSSYLVSRGLSGDLQDPAQRDVFLLGRATDLAERAPGLAAHLAERSERSASDARGGIAGSTLYDQLKAHFLRTAAVWRAQGDERGALRLERASTHWLRHSHASHTIAHGLPIEIAQQNLGHASLATTTVYVTTEQRQRLRAMRKVWGKG